MVTSKSSMSVLWHKGGEYTTQWCNYDRPFDYLIVNEQKIFWIETPFINVLTFLFVEVQLPPVYFNWILVIGKNYMLLVQIPELSLYNFVMYL
jgi:hypothetical protein